MNELMNVFGLLGGMDEKYAVWLKGHTIEGYDPAVWRRDEFGHLIRYSDYDDRDSADGWEKDHIVATVLGGADGLCNLRPLHCLKNASLGGMFGSLAPRP